MKKLLLSLILLSLLTLAYSAQAKIVKLADDQTATGASATACTLAIGYEQLTIVVTRSGTSATIEIECNFGDGTFRALSGTGFPITGTSAEQVIAGYACYQVRVNVTACVACTVNAWCSYNLIGEK